MTGDADMSIFKMYGAQEVINASTSAVLLHRQVSELENAVINNPGLAFDLSKTLIESTCKTILNDRGQPPDEKWDLPKLLKQTLNNLQLVPDSHSDISAPSEALKKIAGGLQTVTQGICDIRNREGFASHGKDGYALSLEATQAQFAARAADAVVYFLFRVHQTYPSQHPARRIRYEDHPQFNDHVDGIYESVEIFGTRYLVSEMLFSSDQEAYREFLFEFVSQIKDDDQSQTE
jgi:hypothetical protein